MKEKTKAIFADRFGRTGEKFLDIPADENGLISELFAEGQRICHEYMGEKSEFLLVDGVLVNALAPPDERAVLVWTGLIHLIYRISSMLAVEELTKNNAHSSEMIPWRGNTIAWLREEGFDLEDAKYWWLKNKEISHVFDFFAINLFRFIVLHEIGHVHNLHGQRRRKKKQVSASSVKPSESNLLQDEDLISAHAREIVADTYAFQFLQHEIFSSLYDGTSSSKREAHIGALHVSQLSTNALFWALSVKNSMDEKTQANKYPTHAFRVQSIDSVALAYPPDGFSAEETKVLVERNLASIADKFEAICGGHDLMYWRLELNNPIHGDHYKKVQVETKKWANTVFGVEDIFSPFPKFRP